MAEALPIIVSHGSRLGLRIILKAIMIEAFEFEDAPVMVLALALAVRELLRSVLQLVGIH